MSARRGPVVAATVAFGLLYAYKVFEAVSNAVSLPNLYVSLAIEPSAVPWWLLVIGMLVPVAGFALAVRLGRGRSVGARVLLLAAGIAVVSALSLTVIALEAVLRPAPFSAFL